MSADPVSAPLPDRRASVEQLVDGVRYTLPPRRNVVGLLFVPLWLAGWGFHVVTTFRLLPDNDAGSLVGILVWNAMWTLVGCWAVYAWLAQIVGKEIVTQSRTTLAIRRRVTGLERAREFDLARVRNLRVSPVGHGWLARRRKNGWAFDPGRIAFEYGPITCCFAAGIDEAEAATIVADLRSRYGDRASE